MGDAFDNVQAFAEEHYGEGPAACKGDGHIIFFAPMMDVYEHSEECTKDKLTRDCTDCPMYANREILFFYDSPPPSAEDLERQYKEAKGWKNIVKRGPDGRPYSPMVEVKE